MSGCRAETFQRINGWMEEAPAPTDYKVIKAAYPTGGGALSPEVIAIRADIRQRGAAAKAAAKAAAATAESDDDKAACDAIQNVRWQWQRPACLRG